jgi:rare lipoprotein A
LPDLVQRRLAAGVLAGLLWLGCIDGALADGAADGLPDYPIQGGHFFRQAAHDPGGKGFRIGDEDGVSFWFEFERLGGVEALGYPISRRFQMDGFVCQATQRAIMQWHPDEGRVQLVNVMEYLSNLGADERLAEDRWVPRPIGDASEETRRAWLEANPKIQTVYAGAVDPLEVFGLPLSPAVPMGPAIAMRLQRGVIYVWHEPQPWTGPEAVSVGNAGDFVKDMKGIPAAALEAEPPPAAREIAQSSRGGWREDGRISGVATWYGAYFQGSAMANGAPYNMHDPTTAASNSHPLGTRLRVTRVGTGRSIVVRVTDRGAFRMPIVVDLSHAAFSRLADPSEGVIRVVVEPID